MVFKKLHKRSFLGGTAAHSLQQHPFEADSATRPSQAGFFIKDELSDYRFLVDTGAFRSILPPPGDINTINHPSSSDLVAANGTSIRTYGEQQVNIRLSGQAYTWTFIIADVRHPLLGADFLSHYSLMVDVARNRLLNIDSFTSTPLCISNIEENINLLSPDGNYADVLEDFDDVFKPELRLSPESSAKHGVQHYIKTTGPPVFSKYRRLRPELLQVAKDAFMEMEKMGVCSKAASPWASPLHMTPKKDGTWRPCGDYRRLNLITEPDHYAMPNISDLTSSIGTSRVFSKLDLLKGYFQVPVNPEDEPKTAITTPFWNICVPLLYIRATQQWSNLSENDGPDFRPSSLLQSLHRRHPGSIRKPQRTSRTTSVCTRTTSQERPSYQKRQMCLWCINCRVSWSQHQWRWHPAPSVQGRRNQQISKTNYSQTTSRIPGDDQLLS